MKFDVVIGNPPYQESDGGAQSSATPIYNFFVEEGKKITSEYLMLIIPTRWFVGGKGLNQFRENMLNDKHIKELHDFLNPEELFPTTNIRGGVCYFLWDQNYDYSNETRVVTYKNKEVISDIQRPMKNQGIDIFIRDPKATKILKKVMNTEFDSFSKIVSPRKPFGFATNFIHDEQYHVNSKKLKDPIICYSRGFSTGYVENKEVKVRRNWIDKWKIYTPRANNIGTELNDDNLNSHIGKPGTICTESYIVIGADLDLDELSVKNLSKYLSTKFVRYLHGLAKASQDASSKTYRFIPLQDFTSDSDIDWTKPISDIDKQLYKKYNLSEEEINFIENNVKEME